MDRLDLIMQILNRVENEGYEPTEEEAKMIVEFLDDVMGTIKVVMKQFREMLIQMAEVINSWWNALPEETRVAIREVSGIPQKTVPMLMHGTPKIGMTSGINEVSVLGASGLASGVNMVINNPFGDPVNHDPALTQSIIERHRRLEN